MSTKSESEVSKAKLSAEPAKSVEGWTIFIQGLHEEVREEDVKDKFADCGDIIEFHMPLARATGYVRGYAIMKYRTKEAGEKAIKELNDVEWMDHKLKVDWAFLAGAHGQN